jgi:hypothetical protein
MPLFWALGRKRFFLKRSKNFCRAVADYPSTAAQKFFGSFFSKKEPLPRRFVLPDV